MIYMVEHGVNDTQKEADWSRWYTGHVSNGFRGIPGWRSGQRFVAVSPSEPKYRAMYTVAAEDVMSSPEYRATTGGRFPEEWRSMITNFFRNLGDAEWMPAVYEDEALLVLDPTSEDVDVAGADIKWMNVVGLDRSVARRGIAVVSRELGEQIAQQCGDGVGVYLPLVNRWAI